MKALLRTSSAIFAACLLMLGAGSVQAQEAEQLGGPYEMDENTVLLMHFDKGSFTEDSVIVNESDSSATGEGHGRLSYVKDPSLQGFGLDQHLKINNSADSYNSFVEVMDDSTRANSALDLTENWTVETWVNITTFGDLGDDWRAEPRIINKPGDNHWFTANYWVYARSGASGDNNFWTGYREDVGSSGSYVELLSPANSLTTSQWFHFALIQDAERGFLIQVISKPVDTDGDGVADDLELQYFNTLDIDAIEESPATTSDKPLFIGQASMDTQAFYLDGFVDEVRISDIVRPFELPPLLRGVTQYSAPTSDEGPYTIEADASTLLGRSDVDDVTLYYRADTTSAFTEVSMANTEDETYSAEIPSQSVGTQVQYYVSADLGDERSVKPAEAENTMSPAYYGFTVTGAVEPSSLMLSLDFEEGPPGPPQNGAEYEADVSMTGVNGEPEYSDDVPPAISEESDYSMHFQKADSSYLSVEGPFQFSPDSLRLEFWFKADSIYSGMRIAANPSDTYFQGNFEVRFYGQNRIAAGSYFPDATFGSDSTHYLMDAMTLDTSLVTDRWYQAVYELNSDSALFRLNDEKKDLVADTTIATKGALPVEATQPMLIGTLREEGSFFFGKIDNFKFYNYPQVLGKGTAIEGPQGRPERVTLDRSYPNPVQSTATISYDMPRASDVKLVVFDVLGRRVRILESGLRTAGTHRVHFDTGNLSSGLYFYRLETDEATRVRRMVVVK